MNAMTLFIGAGTMFLLGVGVPLISGEKGMMWPYLSASLVLLWIGLAVKP